MFPIMQVLIKSHGQQRGEAMTRTACKNQHIKEHYDRINLVITRAELELIIDDGIQNYDLSL